MRSFSLGHLTTHRTHNSDHKNSSALAPHWRSLVCVFWWYRTQHKRQAGESAALRGLKKKWTTIASTERDRRPSSHFSAHSFFTNKLLLFSSCAASLCVYAGWRERRYYCVRELEINIKFHVFALEKRRNNFSIGFNSFISPESWKRSGIEKFAKFLASSRLWLLRDFSQKKKQQVGIQAK